MPQTFNTSSFSVPTGATQVRVTWTIVGNQWIIVGPSSPATKTINVTPVTPATPTFSPVAGTYTSAQSVTISCSTSGATIRYTTDGTPPTTSSPAYSGAITVSSTKTIKAIAYNGTTPSSMASATYTINIPPATPTFSPAAGTYTSAQNVTISCSTSGATIRYTTDGTPPTTSSPAYSGVIAVSSTKTIKAIAYNGTTPSSMASATYTINIPTTPATPTFSPAAGTYTSAQNVTISCSTSGATI
ncbi:MAG: chitobiase/beta-hexosaminidase C-terminal domain-containing protein, partial [Bacillota bacterium]|nr:chitobiase/beta-hexosaminidase C-terminal domain-containing protein [Bacillota bacterium]